MDIKIAREVAARIWCDQDYANVVVNVKLVLKIADMLKREADKQERTIKHNPQYLER